ncbi:MAG: hypothetical protein LRZ85_09290 [Alphaproteobacteria bacterium]|nr:hypothetical protein [Alphaproteobacteria bacterium]
MRDLKEKGGFDHIWFDDGEVSYVHFNKRRVPGSYALYDFVDGEMNSQLYDTSLRHLIYPPCTNGMYSYCGNYTYMAPPIDYAGVDLVCENLKTAALNSDHIQIADYPAVFDIFYRNKIYISRLLQKGVLDPAFYPKQHHYSGAQSSKKLALKIADDFKDSGRIMIKHPTLCQGDGIISLPGPSYKQIWDAIKDIKETDLYWVDRSKKDKRQTVDLVVQEFAEGRKTSIRQSFLEAAWSLRSVKHAFMALDNYVAGDDRPRHNVFRLFISYVNGDLILHDGWLKFSDYAESQAKHDKFISGVMFAGPLSSKRQKEIFEILAPHMKQLFQYLEREGTDALLAEETPVVAPPELVSA